MQTQVKKVADGLGSEVGSRSWKNICPNISQCFKINIEINNEQDIYLNKILEN
jgi:hypothetical protein